MCGIAGKISFGRRSNFQINKKKIFEIMKNRGPDNQGHIEKIEKNYKISLFSSRLKIINLNDTTNMPFKFKNLTIIFNGEIYNFIEIKKFLETKNYSFKFNSDTEVLVKAYHYWGKDCVNYFEGMWAFAILDSYKNQIFLSRDPFGEKPLYYSFNGSNFLFGSEIKYLLFLDDTNSMKEINYSYLKNYITYGYKILNKSNKTYYKNIIKLESGTNLVVKLNSKEFIKKKYFKFNINKKNSNNSEKEIVNNIENLLTNSLKIRLRSDVPITFCLSGGVDSGALVSLAKKNKILVHYLEQNGYKDLLSGRMSRKVKNTGVS